MASIATNGCTTNLAQSSLDNLKVHAHLGAAAATAQHRLYVRECAFADQLYVALLPPPFQKEGE